MNVTIYNRPHDGNAVLLFIANYCRIKVFIAYNSVYTTLILNKKYSSIK